MNEYLLPLSVNKFGYTGCIPPSATSGTFVELGDFGGVISASTSKVEKKLSKHVQRLHTLLCLVNVTKVYPAASIWESQQDAKELRGSPC